MVAEMRGTDNFLNFFRLMIAGETNFILVLDVVH